MQTDIRAIRGVLRGMGLLQKPPPGRVMESRKQREINRRPSVRQIIREQQLHG